MDLAVVTGHTDIGDLDIAFLASAKLVSSDEVHIHFGMEDVHHSWVLALEGQTLKNKVILLDYWQINKRVTPPIASKNVR